MALFDKIRRKFKQKRIAAEQAEAKRTRKRRRRKEAVSEVGEDLSRLAKASRVGGAAESVGKAAKVGGKAGKEAAETLDRVEMDPLVGSPSGSKKKDEDDFRFI